jgi:carbamoyltransferase
MTARAVVQEVLWTILYFGIVTPIGLLWRTLVRRDPLQLRRSRSSTYWHSRPAIPGGAQRAVRQPRRTQGGCVLGISAYYHDSGAALVMDGQVRAAAQEERFTRKRHDASFPHRALSYCLREAKIQLTDVDQVVFYEKPMLKLNRLAVTHLAIAPRGRESFLAAAPLWLGSKMFQQRTIGRELRRLESSFDVKRLVFVEHHASHAASAFFPSPFSEAAILTMDGVGEWATTTTAVGRGNQIEFLEEIRFPHSLGLLFSAFTAYTGFRVNSGEYKLMGLAPYGQPRYAPLILEELVDLREDGSFALNQEYFDYCGGLRMTTPRFEALFGGPPRDPDALLTQRDMDLAASIQAVTEEVVLRLARHLARKTGMKRLCLAGGVALNCVATGKLLRARTFEDLWIQPAAGDAGGALGAALFAHHHAMGAPRSSGPQDSMLGAYLGPAFSDGEIATRLRALGARFQTHGEAELVAGTVEALMAGKAVGWFQGRMEFGPRALGARSILADARSPAMQKRLNLKVKFRESFRPFAPMVLVEDVQDWFDLDRPSPYMLLVAEVAQSRRREMSPAERALFGIDQLNVTRSQIPAVTHVDYSARIQTVQAATNPLCHRLLSEFKRRTGCPVLVNTSFNVRGEPIVQAPEEAFRCFMGTDLDLLAIGSHLLRKEDQDPALTSNYRHQVPRD